MDYAKLIEISQRYIDAIVDIQNEDGQQIGFILTTAATAADGTYVVAATNLDLNAALSINLEVPAILTRNDEDTIGETMGSA